MQSNHAFCTSQRRTREDRRARGAGGVWAKRPVAPAQCKLESALSTGMYRRGGPKQSGCELAGLAKKKKVRGLAHGIEGQRALYVHMEPLRLLPTPQGVAPLAAHPIHRFASRWMCCEAWTLDAGRWGATVAADMIAVAALCTAKWPRALCFKTAEAQQAPRGGHGERTVQSNGQDLLSASTSSSAKRYEASLPTLWETLSPLHSAPRTRLVDAWPDKTRRKKFSALAR